MFFFTIGIAYKVGCWLAAAWAVILVFMPLISNALVAAHRYAHDLPMSGGYSSVEHFLMSNLGAHWNDKLGGWELDGCKSESVLWSYNKETSSRTYYLASWFMSCASYALLGGFLLAALGGVIIWLWPLFVPFVVIFLSALFAKGHIRRKRERVERQNTTNKDTE